MNGIDIDFISIGSLKMIISHFNMPLVRMFISLL